MNKIMLLECKQVSKKFFDKTKDICILNKMELQITNGESVAIVGPSGSGKSTLLHILAGLDKPTSGEIIVAGKALSKYTERDLCRLRNNVFGFVYQHHHLLKDFNVVENIMMPLLIQGMNYELAKRKALSLMHLVNLQDRDYFAVTKLSGGEKQRVAILRALVNDPKILFADEPTGNLCQATASGVYTTLLELKDRLDAAILIVTHDLHLARKMDKVYLLDDGNLVLQN